MTGESGATLVRPELERLRDQASSDGIDRLYVLCPDRLSRKHSHQILLIDELETLRRRAGVSRSRVAQHAGGQVARAGAGSGRRV